MEKWVKHQDNKLFVDSAFQALVPFKEHWEGVSALEKRKGIFFKVEEKIVLSLFRIY